MEYRHQCHVGDHGDALKHPVLSEFVKMLMQQHSSLTVIDTHSGTARYDLTTAPSNHAGEFAEGVGYLWRNKATYQVPSHHLSRSWNTTTLIN